MSDCAGNPVLAARVGEERVRRALAVTYRHLDLFGEELEGCVSLRTPFGCSARRCP